jgi:hypothetical protein
MKNGLSIIVRNESEFEKASEFIGTEFSYMKWVQQMAQHETAIVVWAKKNLHSLSSSFYDDCMKVLAEKVKEDPSSVSLIQEYPEIQDELGGEFSKKFPDLFNIFKSGVNL